MNYIVSVTGRWGGNGDGKTVNYREECLEGRDLEKDIVMIERIHVNIQVGVVETGRMEGTSGGGG